MSQNQKDNYSEEKAARRFEAALRGAFETAPAPKNVAQKKPKEQQKRKLAKVFSSGYSGANA
jgi:hypothetical protein